MSIVRFFKCSIYFIIYTGVFLKQPFVLLRFCVCSARCFCLSHLYIGRTLLRLFMLDDSTSFNGFFGGNTSVKTFFYVVILILSCINNLIYLPFTGYSKNFILLNGALHSFYGFKVCCLKQGTLQDFYFQTKSFYFRITSIELRKPCRRYLFSKVSHEIVFNIFS